MNHLHNFLDFINEVHKVTTDKSASGRTRYTDTIHDDMPKSPKSYSSSVLLKDDLAQRQFQDLLKTLTPQLRRMLQNKRFFGDIDRMAVTINNMQFLKDMKAKRGELRCEYCNAGPLIIYDFRRDLTAEDFDNPSTRLSKFSKANGATCDHKQPQSRGGSKLDYKNLAVCCYKCNSEKGNMDYDEWMLKLPTLPQYIKNMERSLQESYGGKEPSRIFKLAKKRIFRETEKSYVYKYRSNGGDLYNIPKSQIESVEEDNIQINDVYQEPALKFTVTQYIFDKIKQDLVKVDYIEFI